MRNVILILILTLSAQLTFAQDTTLKVGDKVENVEIRDSKNKPVVLPSFGEKNLLIFYADPDKPDKNKYFIDQLEALKLPKDIDFFCFGIVNLKDTALPNGLVRWAVRIKERAYKEQKPTILTDPKHILKKAWNLGDVNNCMTMILIDKSGEILYYQAEELNREQSDHLIGIITEITGHEQRIAKK
ncbi:hypothetical protein FUAX_46140 (plasmid) [Fulvitalea axinellae]|uniref:Peroxiredoxin n=1 Tax=Fulvitalea axinellae TaxID=1182444 RepID=A0AAU9CYZ0_9BACT|nr:hypothetical protein FUAX_46140 [Fulvitalea axinellae]